MTDLSKLTGTVRTMRPQSSNPYGIPWANIGRYANFIDEAAQRYGAEPERIAAHIVIESDGEPRAVQKNDSNGWSYGLMQVVPFGVGWDGWANRVRSIMGVPNATRQQVINTLYDPRFNILVGTSILADFKAQHGSWDKASSAFFTGGPNWKGTDSVNGTTARAYRDTLRALMNEITNQQTTTPETKPTMTDPLRVIVGGRDYTADYGFKSPAAGPYYEYFSGHGGNSGQHTGIDIPGTRGETLYTPASGVVTCAGTGIGQGSWGTSCAAFPDLDGGGAGRVEIMLDSGASLIFGHCARALVSVGQRVLAGAAVAKMGGMNGSHVHVETRVWREDGRCS